MLNAGSACAAQLVPQVCLHAGPFALDDAVHAGVAQAARRIGVAADLVAAQDAVELGAKAFDAGAALLVEKCVRNSTAMQFSCSNAWRSSIHLHSVLMALRCTARRYQVLPISTRRLGVSMFM